VVDKFVCPVHVFTTIHTTSSTVLQSEYTATKQLLGQQQERYGALQAEHSQLLERYHQSEKLVSQLESDLSLVRPLLPPRDVSVSLIQVCLCACLACRVTQKQSGPLLKNY